MASTTPDRRKSDAQSETDRRSAPHWRLRWQVADLAHYTEWHADFAVVENLADQYRRADHVTDLAIERREVVQR